MEKAKCDSGNRSETIVIGRQKREKTEEMKTYFYLLSNLLCWHHPVEEWCHGEPGHPSSLLTGQSMWLISQRHAIGRQTLYQRSADTSIHVISSHNPLSPLPRPGHSSTLTVRADKKGNLEMKILSKTEKPRCAAGDQCVLRALSCSNIRTGENWSKPPRQPDGSSLQSLFSISVWNINGYFITLSANLKVTARLKCWLKAAHKIIKVSFISITMSDFHCALMGL